jgi:hypothetical protein
MSFLGWLRIEGIDFESAAALFVSGPLLDVNAESYFFFDYQAMPLTTHPVASAQVMLHLVNSSPRLPEAVRMIAEHAVSVAPIERALARELLGELLGRGYTPARTMIAELS